MGSVDNTGGADAGLRMPAGAVGRPGLLAAVRRMSNVPEGHLVAVRGPAGWLSALLDREQPVFGWNAHLLGAPVRIEGQWVRDVVIPDHCLVPLGEITQKQLDRAIKVHAREDFDAALADLAAIVKAHDLSAEDLKRQIGRAAQYSWIQYALEVVPAWQALQDLGFEPYPDSSVLRWQRVHNGVELKITAGADLFGRYVLAARSVGARQAMWDESLLADHESRGAVAQRLAAIWRNAFGDAPLPAAFALGDDYAAHRRDMRCMEPMAATLWVNGEMLRTVRRVLKADADIPRGATVWLSQAEGELRLRVGAQVFGCPATGLWIDDGAIALEDFLAIPWPALRGARVSVRREGMVIRFGERAAIAIQPGSTASRLPS